VHRHRVVVACLVFSGLSALVYQLIWTRLLGFSLGTSTEAIAIVLAVFFGGLALGNLAAARWLDRVERPLRVYARLEAAIGIYALASLPVLRHLDRTFAWLGTPESEAGLLGLRIALAISVLLPPTIAMGATLPVVARGLVSRDGSVGRWAAHLYTANTLGAVLGAYLCGFWLIPELGLTRSIVIAGSINLAVAALVWTLSPRGKGVARVEAPSSPSIRGPAPTRAQRAAYLTCFAASGFVAIGYEIVWSKVFGVVMEGTLYGFAAVLSAYLLGIGIGSLAISRRVDAIADLPRAFAVLHVAIGASVVVGTWAVPLLPFAYATLARVAPAGDAVHLLYLLVLPIILVPTALFGAAFPILIRLDAGRAERAGRSIGIATAVNTAGSIAASLVVGFWWIPTLGMDGSLFALLMIDFAAALALLAGFQTSGGAARLRALGGSAAVVATVALSFGGVHIEDAIAGRQIDATDLSGYLRGLENHAASRGITIEGRSSIVSVHATQEARVLRTNGLPESGVSYAPPHASLEATFLGVWPYLLARDPQRALVIGLGGGNTLSALLPTRVESIDVVELERGVARAVALLHEGLPNPLDDPRVRLRVADGRNDLLLHRWSGAPGYDLITSQPSHPWRVGAANLFTEEFFELSRGALRPGGIFAAWLNGFRIDAQALLSVVSSFERIYPGALLVDVSRSGRRAFLLLGSTEPLTLDTDVLSARLAETALADYLADFEVGDTAAFLARIEGPAGVFAAIDPTAANTDDNAFVESRTPRSLRWQHLDFASIESRLPETAPLLPDLRGETTAVAVADAILARGEGHPWPHRHALERLLGQFPHEVPAWQARLLRARADLHDPEREAGALAALAELTEQPSARLGALRARGAHLARIRSAWRPAAADFAAAWDLSRASQDAYDAGRALHPVAPTEAWTWFARIPEDHRGDYPRLAFYAAARALREGASDAELRDRLAALRVYTESDEGRRYPGAHEVAARVAWRLGDIRDARAHADADRRARESQAAPHLSRAETALAEGRLDSAREALSLAAALIPGDPRLATLSAELSVASAEPEATARALTDLRRWATTLEEGIRADNQFRTLHGLALWPQPPTPHTTRSPGAALGERPAASPASLPPR